VIAVEAVVLVVLVAVPAALALGYAVGRSGRARPAVHEASWSELELELERARRHARAFGLALVPAEALPAEPRSLVGALRVGDRAWRDGDGAWILMPEADRAAVDGALRRLAAQPGWGEAAQAARSVVFPDDGITAGALVAALRGKPVGAVPTPLFPREADGAAWAIVRVADRDGPAARTG
jgi:hypothetical protein